MIKRSINQYKPLKIYMITTLALAGGLATIFVIQLLLPISIDNSFINSSPEDILLNNSASLDNNAHTNANAYSQSFRTGMFKSTVALNGKPLADKTIERIKSQLKLQCVMTMNGQLVAYIHINGVGLKKCSVGDSINDMFTILNIDREKKCVDISIIDHKVTLYM